MPTRGMYIAIVTLVFAAMLHLVDGLRGDEKNDDVDAAVASNYSATDADANGIGLKGLTSILVALALLSSGESAASKPAFSKPNHNRAFGVADDVLSGYPSLDTIYNNADSEVKGTPSGTVGRILPGYKSIADMESKAKSIAKEELGAEAAEDVAETVEKLRMERLVQKGQAFTDNTERLIQNGFETRMERMESRERLNQNYQEYQKAKAEAKVAAKAEAKAAKAAAKAEAKAESKAAKRAAFAKAKSEAEDLLAPNRKHRKQSADLKDQRMERMNQEAEVSNGKKKEEPKVDGIRAFGLI